MLLLENLECWMCIFNFKRNNKISRLSGFKAILCPSQQNFCQAATSVFMDFSPILRQITSSTAEAPVSLTITAVPLSRDLVGHNNYIGLWQNHFSTICCKQKLWMGKLKFIPLAKNFVQYKFTERKKCKRQTYWYLVQVKTQAMTQNVKRLREKDQN